MSNKRRIYEIVKDLMPSNIKEKDIKEFKSSTNNKILKACKELGIDAKTTSSSIPQEMVSKVLEKIGQSTKSNNSNQNSAEKENKTETNTDTTQNRIVRRVIRKVEPQPEETEKEESYIQDTPLVEEVSPISSILEKEEPETTEPVTEIQSEIIEKKVEEPKRQVQSSFPKPKPAPNNNTEKKSNNNLSFYERNKNYSTKPQSNFSFSTRNNNSPGSNNNRGNNNGSGAANRNNNRPGGGFAPRRPGTLPGQQPPINNPNRPAGAPAYRPNNTGGSGNNAPGSSPDNRRGPGGQPFRVARPPMNNQFARKKTKGPRKPNKQKVLHRKKLRDQATLEKPSILELKSTLTVQELAEKLLVSETDVIRTLFLQGVMKTITQTLDRELIEQVAEEFECEVIWEDDEINTELTSKLKTLVDTHSDEDKGNLQPRPPVVTIMGHVDHGKTTLLDSIRAAKKDITDGESGGITQHIGAYQVEVTDHEENIRKITFLDTPGHEAFTALRARGAQVTDIAILIVSADDGVMPQTIEAISHAKAAGVPIIVAVNKIDKPDANPDMVLGQLAEHDVIVEDFGGKVVCTRISAKEKLNLDDLLAKITLVADIELEDKLKADPSKNAVGAVIEASLSSSKGTVATVLVQSGTLRKGEAIVAGTASGRIRAIFDDNGNEIDEAPPSSPVQVLGLDSQPQAGDVFEILDTVQETKAQANKQRINQKTTLASSLESLSSKIREGSVKELPIVIKADVQGSAEALVQELGKLSNNEVSVRIIHCAAGAVNESDINLASTAGAILVNFNSVVDAASSKLAKDNNVSIYTYNIIYQVTDAVKKALSGLLEDERIDIKYGEAEVREIFSIGKTKIAGCAVISGKMVSGETAKIVRNGKLLMTVSLTTLKRFKDNVKEVQSGFECGVFLDGFHDYQEGDVIESWGIETKERTFE